MTVRETERDATGKWSPKALGCIAIAGSWRNKNFSPSARRRPEPCVIPALTPKQAARRHPELVGTYLQMHAAQLAARRFRDPQDQEKFVNLVRTALADAVARGEPLPPVRLKEKVAVPPDT